MNNHEHIAAIFDTMAEVTFPELAFFANFYKMERSIWYPVIAKWLEGK